MYNLIYSSTAKEALKKLKKNEPNAFLKLNKLLRN
jgi:mRNA-degrading endonuclease RelE of RelBE toxin-antitoxin system